MKSEAIILLVSCICLTCGIPAKRAVSAQETNPIQRSEDFKILAWPDDKAPGGFMTGLQLVSLVLERCNEIVANAKSNKAHESKPDFKTPLAAAQYFGSHLNMGAPPKYMAVHTEGNGRKYYLFSGGFHWGKQPLFSEVAVLLETGEISFYNRDAKKASDVVSSFILEVAALATNHIELADFPEYVERLQPQSPIDFRKDVKPFAVSFDRSITPVLTKRRIRPSDCGTNGMFLQFVLDDGNNELQAPLDTVTDFPNLKLTLYADVVLWKNAQPELKKTLEDIIERHKTMLQELDKKKAANKAPEDTARKLADPQR